MKIAYCMAPGRGDTDLLLAEVARRLRDDGLRTCGTVQINSETDCDGPCDMDVQILPDGPVIRISQSLGTQSRGCRLNPEALERAVGLVQATLDDAADLMIVNKFGKHEADGRGFRDLIGEALARDLPVLVGLNRINAPAFETFTDGMARALPPDVDRLCDWLTRNTGKTVTAG